MYIIHAEKTGDESGYIYASSVYLLLINLLAESWITLKNSFPRLSLLHLGKPS